MNPGEYSDRITLKVVSDTTETIDDIAIIWAKVKPLSGSRLLSYQQLQVGQWYAIEFTAPQGVTYIPGDPVGYGSKMLTVHSCVQDGLVYKMEAYAK